MGSNQLNPFIEYDRNASHLSVKSGDLIEIQRSKYRHWAICEKVEYFNVWCFHVQVVDDSDFSSATLLYETLEDILKNNNDSKESLFRVNNQEEMALKMMNQNIRGDIKPPDIEELFMKLHSMKDELVEYDVKQNNCEHYVTLWKYGIGWSSQVEFAEKVMQVAGNVGTEMGLKLISRGNCFSGAAVYALGLAAGNATNFINPESLSSLMQCSGSDKTILNQSSDENYSKTSNKDQN